MIENPDYRYFSNRVVLSGAMGLCYGTGLGMLRGHPLVRTAGLTCLSSAMVALPCFGSERLAHIALRHLETSNEELKLPRALSSFFTHAFGGITGGALVGTMYQGRPLNGMVLCVPIMMIFSFADCALQDARDARIEEMGADPAMKQ